MINSVQFNNSKRDFWKEIKNPRNFVLEIIVSTNFWNYEEYFTINKNRRKKLKFKGRALTDPFLNAFPHLEEHL